MTFEENLKYKGNIPLVAYIDFEKTAPADQCRDPKSSKMFNVSYVIISTFCSDLHIDCVIIKCSFGYSLKRLTDLSYLTCKQQIQRQKSDDTIERLRSTCPCEK